MTPMPIDTTDKLIVALLLLQAIWGLFLIVLSWSMRRVLKDIEENTKATQGVATSVNSLNVMLTGNYVLKSEFRTLEERVRRTEQELTELRTIEKFRQRERS